MNRQSMRVLVLLGVIALAALAVVQVTHAQPPGPNVVFVSTKQGGMTDDGVAYGREDILVLISDTWSIAFDGSEYGLTSNRHNINAISVPFYYSPPPSGTLSMTLPVAMMTFAAGQVSVPDITTKVTGQDIVMFYPGHDRVKDGTFLLMFDGSDVGLNTAAERIDGLSYVPYYDEEGPYINHDCSRENTMSGVLAISTVGRYVVPAADGGWLKGSGSDVLLFCMTSGGPNTAGYWYKAFDSANTIPYGANFASGITPRNAIDSISVLHADDEYYNFGGPDGVPAWEMWWVFSVKTPFTAPEVAGQPSDLIFAESMIAPPYSGAYFDNEGSLNEYVPRLNGIIDAMEVPWYYTK